MRHKLDRQELQYKAISKTDISYYVERNTLEHERFIILSAHLWCWECQTGFKTKKTMSVQDPHLLEITGQGGLGDLYLGISPLLG